jgi:hypothetical protein
MTVKNCPCCGWEAEYFYNSSCDCCGQESHSVHCLKCALSIEHRDTKEESLADWNRRAGTIKHLGNVT